MKRYFFLCSIVSFLMVVVTAQCFAAKELPDRWQVVTENTNQRIYIDSLSIIGKDDMIECWSLTVPIQNQVALNSWKQRMHKLVEINKLKVDPDEITMININLLFNAQERKVLYQRIVFMKAIDDSLPYIVELHGKSKWVSVRPDSGDEKTFLAAQEILAEKK